jgi:hypothetical protein
MRLIKELKSNLIGWAANPNAVTVEFKWSQRDQKFYVCSAAGTLEFKPKTLHQMVEFRGDIGNRIMSDLGKQGVSENLKSIYYDSIKKYRARYRATLRMRMKLVI